MSAKWTAALKAKGHTPVLDKDGKIDWFVCDNGYHNGPGCSVCLKSWCEHCTQDPDTIDECEGAPEVTPDPRDALVADMAKSDCDGGGFLERNDAREITREVIEAVCPTLLQSLAATPIKMILHCPACGLQHIDEPSPPIGVEPTTGDGGLVMWTNPPHRSHLCHGCGHIWRPADVATEGVARIETVGKADSPRVDPQASLAALTEERDRLREGLEELLNLDRVAGVPVDSEACSYWAGQVDEMRSIASSTLTARPTP